MSEIPGLPWRTWLCYRQNISNVKTTPEHCLCNILPVKAQPYFKEFERKGSGCLCCKRVLAKIMHTLVLQKRKIFFFFPNCYLSKIIKLQSAVALKLILSLPTTASISVLIKAGRVSEPQRVYVFSVLYLLILCQIYTLEWTRLSDTFQIPSCLGRFSTSISCHCFKSSLKRHFRVSLLQSK